MANHSYKDENGESYYINIDDYYDQVHRTTWARRTSGFLAGATIGVAIGATIGAASAFIPYALGAMGVPGAAAIGLGAAAAHIPAVAGLFAASGGFLGMVINADVSVNAASTAAGMEEKEKREKIDNGRSVSHAHDNEKHAASPARPQTLEEKGPPLFSWKVGLTMAGMFAAFGALIAFGPAAASVFKSAFPTLTSNAAHAIASAGVFAMFGSTIGLKMSLISNKVTNFYYKLITNQYFEKEPAKEPEKAVSRVPEFAAEQTRQPDMVMVKSAVIETKPFAAKQQRFSVQELIEQRDNPSAEPEVLGR